MHSAELVPSLHACLDYLTLHYLKGREGLTFNFLRGRGVLNICVY